MKWTLVQVAVLIAMAALAVPGVCQTPAELQAYLTKNIGLTEAQVSTIRSGQAVATTLPSRTPAEIFIFGAIYINSTPDAYVEFASDFNRLRKIPEYLAIEPISNPPQLSDFKGFGFDDEDFKALKDCKPGDCDIQMPGATIEQLHKSINWSAPDAKEQVNQFAQKMALQRLLVYQKEGGRMLGTVYNDKSKPTNVADQFQFMLSYGKAFPNYLPDFYNYLLDYPNGKPANVETSFYWTNVKFGLKPTLRLVQVFTLRGSNPKEPAYAIAGKQLYSSHYFETALDLTFCINGSDDPKQPGFYLIMVMSSEQAGLTGFKGSIVRKVAVDRSVKSMQSSLTSIKSSLEHH